MTRNMRLANNFMVVDARKPINDPKADLNALFKSFGSWIISPTKAPTKAPITKPSGIGRISPITKPTVAPVTPFFEPPNFLAPRPGII